MILIICFDVSFFGLAALIVPSNLLDVYSYFEIPLSEKFAFSQDGDLFWRMSKNDGYM
jgi:hypothetical protein